MEKTKANLVVMPGCHGCGKTCKYNAEIADPSVVSSFDNTPYGCNSKLFNLEIREGEGHVNNMFGSGL
jgi:hypothetical protein